MRPGARTRSAGTRRRGRWTRPGSPDATPWSNLAGAGVGDRRWSDAYKRRIHDSRVHGTAALAKAVASLDAPPRVFVNGSAMGFYGETGERIVDEGSPAGHRLPAGAVRGVGGGRGARAGRGRPYGLTRTGLVVARGGGAWGRLFPLFTAGLGGRMGDGRQYWSYIALHDEVAAIRHLARPRRPVGARST